MIADHRTAPITEAERALLAFVEKVNSRAPEMTRGDIEAALAAGWTEEALYDAITVCSLFNFYNRWCDAAGVHAPPEEVLRRSAKKMAGRGYAM